jgi:hypothetical protein
LQHAVAVDESGHSDAQARRGAAPECECQPRECLDQRCEAVVAARCRTGLFVDDVALFVDRDSECLRATDIDADVSHR